MESSMNQDQLKNIIKTAFVKVLEERPDLLDDAIEGALEDVAFARAIEDGENTELIQREEVLSLLEGKAGTSNLGPVLSRSSATSREGN